MRDGAECTGLSPPPHASNGLRLEGILRPVMFRIPAPHVLAHFGVRPPPEACQVARHLHGPLCRREQLEGHGYSAAADPWRRVEAEDLLQAHGYRRRALVRVIDVYARAARHGNMGRGQRVEFPPLVPTQPRPQRIEQGDAGKVLAPSDPVERRCEPVVDRAA